MTTDPRPAATIVLVSPTTPPSVYLVKRHGRSGFMAGAHVFPGGRVDDEDAAAGQELPVDARRETVGMLDRAVPDSIAAAFCCAAIRETAEECGVLLAVDDDGQEPSRAVATEVFTEIGDTAATFYAALRRRGLRAHVERLAPLAWWVTPEAEPKRYDTRFFLAEAPADHEATVDRHEVTEGEWMTVPEALAAYREARIQLAPPTLATLEDLNGIDTVEEMRASVRRPVPKIRPILVGDPDPVLALPGDPLHDVEDAVWPQVRSRFVVGQDGRFRSLWHSGGR